MKNENFDAFMPEASIDNLNLNDKQQSLLHNIFSSFIKDRKQVLDDYCKTILMVCLHNHIAMSHAFEYAAIEFSDNIDLLQAILSMSCNAYVVGEREFNCNDFFSQYDPEIIDAPLCFETYSDITEWLSRYFARLCYQVRTRNWDDDYFDSETTPYGGEWDVLY